MFGLRSFLHFLWSPLAFFSSRLNALFRTLYLRVYLLADSPGDETRDAEIGTPNGRETGPKYARPDRITYICIDGSSRHTPQPCHGEVIYVTKGKVLAWGGTAVVEQLPSGTVMKTPIPNPYDRREERDHRDSMRLEARIYSMIGEHPRVPKILHWDETTCCLEMECLIHGNLKEYIQNHDRDITPQLRLRWSQQAAEALSVLHTLHCDLSPRNFLLDGELNLKISDFGGASLCGADPSASPETRFRHPGYDWNAPPTMGDDLFSLGSLIYFIMTGSYPYRDTPSDEVEKLYEAQEFPNMSSIICSAITLKCWRREVDSTQTVHEFLTKLENEPSQNLE